MWNGMDWKGNDAIQSVRVKGIQTKIIIPQKAFLIHIYGLQHYKGKLLFYF
jgi:hypothetical protein